MNATNVNNWAEANQRYLMARLAVVREALSRRAARVVEPSGDQALERELDEASRALNAPAALDRLCSVFELSAFERDVLLLCASVELDPAFHNLCKVAQGGQPSCGPTFALALASLPDAHWRALAPMAPLRYWRLIEVASEETLTSSQLRIDERILHYLTGVSYLDTRLQGVIETLWPPGNLSSSHQRIAQNVAGTVSRAEDVESWPVIHLCGDAARNRAVAAYACALLDVQLHLLRASDIPVNTGERAALIRLWDREALLSNSALLLEYDDSASARAAMGFIERETGMLFVSSREPLPQMERQVVRFDVGKLSAAEQIKVWQSALGPIAERLNGQLEALTAQFTLDAQQIRAAGAQVLSAGATADESELTPRLWAACREQTRERLDDLAQRIESSIGWDDLVLPEPQMQTLREIAAQVRRRTQVYERWGFAAKSSRGLGISALFSGASGTGKTMASEVIANELQLDLYRIDLSQVVSKYIGETEKNLRRVFDAAQEGGAILLFDEADAIFGKRSEVKDSHDRYANIEVSYLLQRMEAYRGLAILTTNMKALLDTAFLRRLRFIVHFPLPDAAQRAEIWRRVFPEDAPTEGLNVERLAQLNVTGGHIRNIALHSSFLAADAGEPVRMRHLLRAARGEYAKLEKPLSEQETKGWI